MKQYTVHAVATAEVVLEEVPAVLEPGTNVFTVFSNDITPLLANLAEAGVKVVAVHCMQQPSTTLADVLVNGESIPMMLQESHVRR